MKIFELNTELDNEINNEWQASKKLCRSSRPNDSLGASALASCKSQGLRNREGKKAGRKERKKHGGKEGRSEGRKKGRREERNKEGKKERKKGRQQ